MLDAGLSRYNTPSRYLDSTTKSPYSRTLVNQYLHRNVEAAVQGQISNEYLPLLSGGAPTVEDEGRLKNFLQKYQIQTTILVKESVEFSDSSFRTILQNLLWKSISYFTLEAQFRTPSGQNCRERERDYFSVELVCLRMEIWSAIYSAPGGHSRPPEVNSCDGSDRTVATVQLSNRPTARTVFRQPLAGGSNPFADTRWQASCLDLERTGYRSGAGLVRAAE